MEERFRLQLGKIMGTSGAKNEACKEANKLLQSILSKLVVPIVVPMVVPMMTLVVLYGIGVVGCCPHRGRVSGGIWAGLILLNM